MFANMNILTDEECEIMFKPMGGSKQAILLNNRYDICAGKKHPFPHSIISFERRKKRRSAISKEKSEAKKSKVSARIKPTQFYYKISPKQTRVSLGTPEDYSYKWFLGGVDSCQGDSGGPFWRNIKVILMKYFK